MVQVIQRREKKEEKPSFGQEMMKGIFEGAQQIFQYKMQQDAQQKKFSEELASNKEKLGYIEKLRGLEPGSLQAFADNPAMAEQLTREPKQPKTPLTEKPVPEEISNKINNIISKNPEASADELRQKMDSAGIPPIYSNPYTENRRRTEEQKGKTTEEKKRALRQETLPIRAKLAEKAAAAEKGIQNKEELLRLIEKGDINDPTYATLAESLPLELGKRLLSNDTTVYKAGLVDEFTDLRNIFQGQTRIKEIDLLENKLADIYLTDDQKRAVLNSRIKALRADIIKAEAAAELEDRDDLGVLQFNAEVEKRGKPKLEALFSNILDEHKSIIQNAENRKKIPLDINDPDDIAIIDQFLLKANKNPKKAKELAEKAGYKF